MVLLRRAVRSAVHTVPRWQIAFVQPDPDCSAPSAPNERPSGEIGADLYCLLGPLFYLGRRAM